ncbi:Glutamate receptor ionotropic, kainate glr-3 [Frankliniella fusca]|uniref:Glutamate receptor ionotropic, kainate glr-3 n=1 Tax=Frankliniella fusca TaxID=407009 RepID=A0AAE1H0D2_9NEOP|nr:Glutamate receptor ionotropic, kainate glr-3 [Frankliniella fusca]
MDVFLVVILLCVCAAGVRGALRAEEPAAPPEARAAAALLTPFLEAQRATLVLRGRGRARWTDAYLRQLPGSVARVVEPVPNPEEVRATNPQQQLMAHLVRHVFLVAARGPRELVADMRAYSAYQGARFLFWVPVPAARRQRVLGRISLVGLFRCGRVAVVAFTDPHDGSTVLYDLKCDRFEECFSGRVDVTEVDAWSPAQQRWPRNATALFDEFCGGWRVTLSGALPGPPPRALSLPLMTSKTWWLPLSSLMETCRSIATLVDRGQQQQQQQQQLAALATCKLVDHIDVFARLRGCTLDAALTNLPDPVEYVGDGLSAFFDEESAQLVAIVPAYAGRSSLFLHTVVVEFSASVWGATLMAMLVLTVAVLALARLRPQPGRPRPRPRRRDLGVGVALLQTLAPLLGQPPPPPAAPAAPRPVLAAWLLTCLVLTAGYQGLLLNRLSTRVPGPDLLNLRDLQDSGLPVYTSNTLASFLTAYLHTAGREGLFPEALASRLDLTPFSVMPRLIRDVAFARNCAVITYLDRHTDSLTRAHLLPPRRLHLIRLPLFARHVEALAMKGSPLERPLGAALSRLRSAGLLQWWRSSEHERERVEHARKLESLRAPRALTLWQLAAAFHVLGVGHVASVACFALEALLGWRCSTAGRRRARRLVFPAPRPAINRVTVVVPRPPQAGTQEPRN